MKKPSLEPQEKILRLYRRNEVILLVLVLWLGGTIIISAVWPDTVVAFRLGHVPWYLLVPLLLVFTPQAWMRKHGVAIAGPEANAVQRDEWRQATVSRAAKAALVAVLCFQLPVGFLLRHLPAVRALVAMGATTVTLGAATFLALFLFFDREAGSEQ